jgi:hypothetical protein
VPISAAFFLPVEAGLEDRYATAARSITLWYEVYGTRSIICKLQDAHVYFVSLPKISPRYTLETATIRTQSLDFNATCIQRSVLVP